MTKRVKSAKKREKKEKKGLTKRGRGAIIDEHHHASIALNSERGGAIPQNFFKKTCKKVLTKRIYCGIIKKLLSQGSESVFEN